MIETEPQARAVRLSVLVGFQLTKEHPEIAELYRKGKTFIQILNELNISSEYGITKSIARGAVRYSMAGHSGGLRIESYVGLMAEEEFRRTTLEHSRRSGRNISSSARAKALESNGFTAWSLEEFSDALAMSQSPICSYSSGPKIGKPDMNLISRILNLRYHNGERVRNRRMVASFLYRKRKGL